VGEFRPVTQELLLRDRRSCKRKRSSDLSPVLHFLGAPFGLRDGRTRDKLHRGRDHYHRLSLNVGVPLRRRFLFLVGEKLLNALLTFLPPLLIVCPLMIHLLQPRFLLPRPEQPFRRSVKTRITRAAVHVLNLRQQRLAIFWRKLLLAILPQAQK